MLGGGKVVVGRRRVGREVEVAEVGEVVVEEGGEALDSAGGEAESEPEPWPPLLGLPPKPGVEELLPEEGWSGPEGGALLLDPLLTEPEEPEPELSLCAFPLG